ncbi:hypothetical protein [Barrientosiimonas endolithica]|uniref:DUF4332 domain-containing protein n=1 Tax=Barrientosiimonas endolithica TaxID=1535208 RepID=A0ABN6YKC1_9MICO|nr:hypothetical protein [Barrientosiimonas endolithica]BDZ57793.1 hypothetical protein GCM10025872_14500 [Barrientosiimonas endolithica]
MAYARAASRLDVAAAGRRAGPGRLPALRREHRELPDRRGHPAAGAVSGDLRRLRDEADGDPAAVKKLLQEFPRIGPTGADIFCREVQQVWPGLRPQIDAKVRAVARKAGLPTNADDLAALVAGDDLARFTAALVRLDHED